MTNMEKAQQMIPLITCENSHDQYFSELFFDINVFD